VLLRYLYRHDLVPLPPREEMDEVVEALRKFERRLPIHWRAVLACAKLGMGNEEIAQTLGLARRTTVQNYVPYLQDELRNNDEITELLEETGYRHVDLWLSDCGFC
jgi:hypothetical protein